MFGRSYVFLIEAFFNLSSANDTCRIPIVQQVYQINHIDNGMTGGVWLIWSRQLITGKLPHSV